MPRSRSPYPAEFRRQMVELVQTGRTPAELSREFGVTSQSIAAWVAQVAVDSGKPLPGKDVLSTAEREELARLRHAGVRADRGRQGGRPRPRRASRCSPTSRVGTTRAAATAPSGNVAGQLRGEQPPKARQDAQRIEHGISAGGACVAGATPPVDIPAPQVIDPPLEDSRNRPCNSVKSIRHASKEVRCPLHRSSLINFREGGAEKAAGLVQGARLHSRAVA